MGRGKKSLSHQLGKITTWKVAMSSQPDAGRGGNPSLCRRKGDHQLWIRMLQALQRFVLHWDKSAEASWCLLVPILHFPSGGLLSTLEHLQFLFWVLPCCSVLLRSDWFHWGSLGILALSIPEVAGTFFCSHLPNPHWLTCLLPDISSFYFFP